MLKGRRTAGVPEFSEQLQTVFAEDRRMHSRPLSFLGRVLLTGCAMGLGASTLVGQSSSAAPAQSQTPASRSDVFLGFSYLAPHGTVTTTLNNGSTISNNYSSIN